MCSTSGTELRGDPAICPGNRAIFECKTTNTGILTWKVNDVSLLSFTGADAVVGGGIADSGNVASLVELDLISGNIGDRTSLLLVAPGNDVTMTITCDGGNLLNTCNKSITFLGKSVAEYSHAVIYFHVLRAHLNLLYRNGWHRKASIW